MASLYLLGVARVLSCTHQRLDVKQRSQSWRARADFKQPVFFPFTISFSLSHLQKPFCFCLLRSTRKDASSLKTQTRLLDKNTMYLRKISGSTVPRAARTQGTILMKMRRVWGLRVAKLCSPQLPAGGPAVKLALKGPWEMGSASWEMKCTFRPHPEDTASSPLLTRACHGLEYMCMRQAPLEVAASFC